MCFDHVRGMPRQSLPTGLDSIETDIAPWSETPQRSSAVCMLFVPNPAGSGPAHLVLTKRSIKVGSHKGQVAFAGGHRDATDADPAETALRELEEELGVPSHKVQVFGQLTSQRAMTGLSVIPIVAAAEICPTEFTPSFDEVDVVVTAEWTNFLPSKSAPFQFNLFGQWRHSELFRVDGHIVWGLTAKIIREAALR